MSTAPSPRNGAKPKLIHVISNLSRGGMELGVATMLREGFYNDFDTRIVALTQGDGKIRDEYAAHLGAEKITQLTDSPKITPRDVLSAASALHKFFRATEPNAVILSSPVAQIVGRLAALGKRKIRVASFEHFTARLDNARAAGTWVTSPRTDLMFVDTPFTIGEMKRYYPLRPPALEVPMTILKPGTVRPPSNPETIRLLTFARLVPEKNLPLLIDAVALLRIQGYHIEADIYGEGPQKQNLRTLAKMLGVSDAIRLNPFMADRDRLAEIRDHAHIYVQPSKAEGFCLAVAEALAAGLPTVTTNVGGMRDYGRHGVNILKFDTQTAIELARNLKTLIDNYAILALRLSQGAIATAHQTFSAPIVHEKWRIAKQALMQPRTPSTRNPGGLHSPQQFPFG